MLTYLPIFLRLSGCSYRSLNRILFHIFFYPPGTGDGMADTNNCPMAQFIEPVGSISASMEKSTISVLFSFFIILLAVNQLTYFHTLNTAFSYLLQYSIIFTWCTGDNLYFSSKSGDANVTGGDDMDMKTIAVTAGLGVAVGMVAVLAMPRSNPTRKLATKAANKVEDLAWKVSDTITDKMDLDM